MEVGMLYHGSQHYGGSYHDLGLFKVLKLGKKFASLKQIETKQMEELKKESSPCDFSSCGKRQACLPIKINCLKIQLVSFIDYDEERNIHWFRIVEQHVIKSLNLSSKMNMDIIVILHQVNIIVKKKIL